MGRISMVCAIVALTFVAGAPALAAPDKAGVIEVLGAGTRSCGSWTADHQSRDGDDKKFVDDSWVMGYVTGFNSWGSGTNDASGNIDNNGLLAWVTNYCASNPLDTVSQAASALIVALYLKTKP